MEDKRRTQYRVVVLLEQKAPTGSRMGMVAALDGAVIYRSPSKSSAKRKFKQIIVQTRKAMKKGA